MAMNATLRTPEQLRMVRGNLQFQSLAADTLTWESVLDDATGAGVVVPQEEQVVQLYKDGERRFYGHVSRVEYSLTRVSVEVQGPWWWLQKVMLSGNQTAPDGGAAERTKFVLPNGSLRTMFNDLIDRFVALNIPLQRGSVAGMYDFVRLTLSDMSCAAALTKLMARCPDAVALFDYTGADYSLPVLKIARRNGASAMADKTYVIADDRVTLGKISARTDQEVTRVELPYMDRHPVTGKPRFQQQGNGTAQLGKLQLVTVSGPEIVNFLPKDDFENASIKTVLANQITDAYIAANDSGLAAISKEYGISGGRDSSFRTYSGDTNQSGGVTRLVTTNHNFPGLTFTRNNGDALNNLTGRYLVVTSGLPEWAKEQWSGIDVTVTGTWIAYWDYAGQGNNFDARFEALRAGAQVGSGFFNSNLSPSSKKAWAARAFSLRAVLLQVVAGMPDNPPWDTAKTVYKKWDYEFLTPPAGMAEGLRQAQNWTPYEGSFETAGNDVPGTNLLDKAVNLQGSRTSFATMRAMIKTLNYDLLTKRTTIALGAPARTNLATAMGRVPTSPQDVIEYIG